MSDKITSREEFVKTKSFLKTKTLFESLKNYIKKSKLKNICIVHKENIEHFQFTLNKKNLFTIYKIPGTINFYDFNGKMIILNDVYYFIISIIKILENRKFGMYDIQRYMNSKYSVKSRNHLRDKNEINNLLELCCGIHEYHEFFNLKKNEHIIIINKKPNVKIYIFIRNKSNKVVIYNDSNKIKSYDDFDLKNKYILYHELAK